MGKRSTRRPPAPRARPRKAVDGVFEALPDFLAAATCTVALIEPDWPGYDLLRTSAALFPIELPLAIIVTFAGVMRIDDRSMDRATKRGFVLLPTLILAALSTMLFGRQGLVAVVWLSAPMLYRLFRGIAPRDRTVPGFWVTYTEGDGDSNSRGVDIGAGSRGRRGAKSWRVEGGADQFEASLTVMFWFVIAGVMAFVQLPEGGATEAYAHAVGWDATAIGRSTPAAKALWAGAILFGLRMIGKIDFAASAAPEPIAKIEDDPVLAEIVRKVDAKK